MTTKRTKAKPETYSKFFELYVGELLEIITNLRTVETLEDVENGTVVSTDKPMVLEGMLLDECESFYHFGDPNIGVTNSLVKTQVVHVAIIREDTIKKVVIKSPIDKSDLN